MKIKKIYFFNLLTLSITISQFTFETAFFGATNVKLFLIFLKIGAILYGSGYVLFAFLDAVNVASIAIIKSDCVVVGQDILTDWKTITIMLICLLVNLKFPKNQ